MQLQLLYGVKLEERNSLIIFDEVQFNPKARQSIKKLVADGRSDYIETGSLIFINKNVKDILIPSEERKISSLYDAIPSELISSKTVLASYNISDPNVGMSNTYNLDNFRLYSTDIGY